VCLIAPRTDTCDADITEYIELQVLPVAAATTAELPLGNADQDDPEESEVDNPVPLGVKLTTYRLLNLVIIFASGLAKFILSLKGQSAAPTGLEWAAGTMFAVLSYWIGLYEPAQPPRWEWLLHVDLAPAIGFIMKCFLGGVPLAFSVWWEMLPFCLFIGVPLFVLSRVTAYTPPHSGLDILLAELIVALLFIFLPEKWRVWNRMWVWGYVERFFRKYRLNYLDDRRSYLVPWGSIGHILVSLPGSLLVGVFVHRYVQSR